MLGHREAFPLPLISAELSQPILHWDLPFCFYYIFFCFVLTHSLCLLARWLMYIQSNLPSILWLGHHHKSWLSLVIFSFDLLTIQDLRFFSLSTWLLPWSLPLVLILLPPLLRIFKERSFTSYNLYRKVVSGIILASLGFVLVNHFSATLLLYLSVAFLFISPAGTSVTVNQSSLVT